MLGALGWVKGFEPLTAGATVRSSTTELHPPRSQNYIIRLVPELIVLALRVVNAVRMSQTA